MAALTIVQGAVFAEIPEIPAGMVPNLPDIHKKVLREDFDANYHASKWTGVTVVQGAGGNNIGMVSPNTTATYGANSIWLGNVTIQANLKVDYVNEKWTEIMNIGYRNENQRGKIMLYQNAGKTISKVYFATVGQQSNLWTSKDIPADHNIFKGEWVKLKVELNAPDVSIYLDDELLIKTAGYTLADSWLAFKTFVGGSTIYIDNLLVSRKRNVPDVIPTVQKDPEKYTVLYQDFENLKQGTMDEMLDMGYGETGSDGNTSIYNFNGSIADGFDGGQAYNFLGNYLLPMLDMKDTYTIEMNIKLDPRVGGAYSKSWPEFRFNRYYAGAEYGYKLYFNVSDTTATPSLYKINAGKETWIGKVQGEGTLDMVECTGCWSYLKIEKTPDSIKLYWNSKDKPCYTWADSSPIVSGGLRINSSTAEEMIIDNLYISTPYFPSKRFTADAKAKCAYSEETDTSVISTTVTASTELETAVDVGGAIVAAYDNDNRLVGVGIEPFGILPPNPRNGSSAEITEKQITFNVPGNGSQYKYKAFLWDMESLCPNYSIIDMPSI